MRYLEPGAARALVGIGRTVREARHAGGMTQRDLQDLSGVHQSMISRLENGRAPGMRIVALARIMAGLGWAPRTLGGNVPTGIAQGNDLDPAQSPS
jgi:transcriptional regulator with XRE-family HTH domain